MTQTKKPYDICIIEDYEHNGDSRTAFHRIGVAFEAKEGGFSCQTFPGAAITGRFVILPRKTKDAVTVEG